MSKIAIIADTHFGARGDSLVFAEYFYRFFEDIFFPTLQSLNIKQVWVLGDFVDRRKFINFKILSSVRKRFLHPLEDMGVKIKVLIGNHDTYHRNTNEVNAIQELLGGWDNIEIFDTPEEFDIDGRKVLFVPWITQDNQEFSRNMIDVSNADILAGHLEINGFQMYAGTKCETGIEPSVFEKFQLTLSGHFHHKSTDGDITYVGSPYEMTFGDMNDPKGFHILDTQDLSLTFVQNPYQMFHRVIYDDRGKTLDATLKALHPVSKYENTYVKIIVNHKGNPYYFDKFIDLLYSVSPAEVKVIEDFTYEAQGEDTVSVAEDTLTVLNKYIDQIDYVEVNKTKLKDIMKTLYLEANNLER